MTVTSEEDLEQFRVGVRSALSAISDSARVRSLMATERGWDDATWRVLAGQLDLAGLMLPEEVGGSGLGPAELSVAIEECGAALVCSPLFATSVLAVPLLLALDDPVALSTYGPRIAGGELTATVALAEAGAQWDVASVRANAQRTGDGWAISGVKHNVVDGATAGLLLVVAQTWEGLGVFAVPRDAPGITVQPLVTLDLTRKMARLEFAETPATLIGSLGDESALTAATDVSRALLAAEQTGVAQRSLDMIVDYAKTRIQFGRPIGQFQVIKQRLADALIQIESARSAAYVANRSLRTELARNSRVAAIMATEAATWITAQAIQLHGGIGFTWEHDAHLYFKRARASAGLLGQVGEHVKALGDMLEQIA
ncbi:acyl-CoA dehydrogenase [Rhizocola hellebori]|uniref:Acyl-CoA dehydrogenase n=1 Tax=Rhizocola hellebori TaxID=1392758 RepID=A0A8J3QBN0_9ACTN|nr:acyl-CoA dehydrogenase family protein [Rhizocola hellebori]GIH06713.1 acyl-CoA dehydrogenase [Rhizocola hellebori]